MSHYLCCRRNTSEKERSKKRTGGDGKREKKEGGIGRKQVRLETLHLLREAEAAERD